MNTLQQITINAGTTTHNDVKNAINNNTSLQNVNNQTIQTNIDSISTKLNNMFATETNDNVTSIRAKMNIISDYTITGSNTASSGTDGKTPELVVGTVNSLAAGNNATVSMNQTSTDENGNPIYTINFGIPVGAQGATGAAGKTPIFSATVSVTTLDAGTNATASISNTGSMDANGNPVYSLSFGIPKGADGTGGSSTEGRLLVVNTNNCVTSTTYTNQDIYNFNGSVGSTNAFTFRQHDMLIDYYKNIFGISSIATDGLSCVCGTQLSK